MELLVKKKRKKKSEWCVSLRSKQDAECCTEHHTHHYGQHYEQKQFAAANDDVTEFKLISKGLRKNEHKSEVKMRNLQNPANGRTVCDL